MKVRSIEEKIEKVNGQAVRFTSLLALTAGPREGGERSDFADDHIHLLAIAKELLA